MTTSGARQELLGLRRVNPRRTHFALVALACSAGISLGQVDAQQYSGISRIMPPPSKVVIVFEENKSFSQIIGNPEAPYMNQLAAGGMLFTSFYAITHPSQPNYLEFFGGTNQGVFDNEVPAPGTPFTSPNLAASLMDVGASFVGYAEGLPWGGSTVSTWGYYTRITNPWVNWQAGIVPGPNQIDASQNVPFWMFPPEFQSLPSVSIVVPSLLHNMHDGTIAQGDAWLAQNIGPFADWAMANNGLLIVTFDEDESQSRNRIPTIMYGPMVRTGVNNSTWTLHNLLRTVQDLYGATPCGTAARVSPIRGFSTDPTDFVETLAFRNGENGYTGALDTYVAQDTPSTSHGLETSAWTIDAPRRQGLIRFDGIFGSAADQIPPSATIVSAKLSVLTGVTTQSDRSFDTVSLHRMLTDWGNTSTWNSLVDGVSTDDVEATSQPEFWLVPNVGTAWAIFDVTASVQSMLSDPSSNHGWLIRSSGSDTWRWRSSEWPTLGDRPTLEIVIQDTDRPGGFLLEFPADGTTRMPTQPMLTWSASSNAALYTVTIATDPALTNAVHVADVLSANSYEIPASVLSDCSTYYWGVVASNGFGTRGSSPQVAGFSTLHPADFDADGYLSPIDYNLYINAFEAGDMSADFNGDGFLDPLDYNDFINHFEAGC